MEQQELLYRLKILKPEANFSIWSPQGDYFGETTPCIRFEYKIDWRYVEDCPSEEQINSVTEEQIQSYKDEENDKNLLVQYGQDLQMKMLYKLEKQVDTNLSYLDFIKNAVSYNVQQ